MSTANPTPADDLLRHQRFVVAVARAVLDDPDDAEDAAQDAWLSVVQTPPSDLRSPRSWLALLVRRRAVDVGRRRSRRRHREEGAARREALPSAAQLAERAELGRTVIALALALPEDLRVPLLLRYQEGLSPPQIAARLECPLETVRTRLRRSLERLRASLQEKAGLRGGDWRLALVPLAVPTSLGGALVVKKSALVAACVVLVGGGTWWGVEALGRRPPPVVQPAPVLAAEGPPAAVPPPNLTGRGGGPPAAPQAPRAPGPRLAFSGTLLDEGGAPVPGAWLEFVKAEVPPTAAPTDHRIAPDEKGRFRVEVPDARSQITVRIRSDTHVARWGGAETLVFPGRPAEIVLVPAAQVRVQVLDLVTGHAIADATAATYEVMAPTPEFWRTQRPKDEATTDAQGLATVRAKAGSSLLVVRAKGYRAGVVANLSVPSAGTDATVRLGRGGTIAGRFVDPAGRPAPPLVILAMGFPPYEAQSATDSDGRFMLTHVPIASDPVDPVLGIHLRLWCQRRDAPSRARHFVVKAPLADGGTAEATLVWLDERPLGGIVRASDGSPAAGITVTALPNLERQLNFSAEPVKTGADGRFLFDRCVPGRVVVHARLLGPTSEPVAETTVDLPAEGPAPEALLVLPASATRPAATVAVRILDAEGNVVTGGAVHFEATSLQGARSLSGTPAAADGIVTLREGMRPGARTWGDAPSYAPTLVVLTEQDVARGSLDLRLGGGSARGRVVRLDGAPVKTTSLRATLVVRGADGRPRHYAGGSVIPTDEAGRFEIRGLAEDEVLLGLQTMELRLVGGQVAVRRGDDVEVVAGSEEELQGLFVEAVVLDAETGAPPERLSVMPLLLATGASAQDEPVARLQGVAGSLGLHRTFYPMRPGVYDVVLPQAYGYLETRVNGVRIDAAAQRQRVTLRLNRGLAVTGRVLDEMGAPVRGVTVLAGRQSAGSGADGTYRITGLVPGPVEVRVTGPYAESKPLAVDVAPGAGGIADFRVAVGGAIFLRIPASEFPIRDLVVAARHEDGRTTSTRTFSAAEVEREVRGTRGLLLPRLLPGRWRLDVEWDGRRLPQAETDVQPVRLAEVSVSP